MKIPTDVTSWDDLQKLADGFIRWETKGDGHHRVCARCNGAIRRGFINCWYANERDEVEVGDDGFGIGPVPVPYCETCDPPDGFHHTYAVRVRIKKEK